jgi:gliding motility-associated-like protein
MKENELEDMFKKSFENFEAEVNPSVWKNIQTGLKGAGVGVLAKMLLNKIGTNAIVAIVSSAATVVGTVLVMNYSGNKTEIPKPITETPSKQIAEKPVPVAVDEAKNIVATPNNETKKAVVDPTEKKPVNNQVTLSVKNKKLVQKELSAFSEDRIASISSSCIGGAVPLIVNLSNIGTGKINKWSFNDGTKSIIGSNPIKVFDVPGLYTIMLNAIDSDGKTAVDSLKIEVTGNSSLASMPSEFSPNGDGKEDVFTFTSKNIVNMNATVYDTKGNVVYDYTGINGKWDGTTLTGAKAKEGLYLYIVSATGADGKKLEAKGKIKLTR